ncbi:MAG: hypothetical protein RMK32_07485 [Anaerolineae bacterium]|nr:hypothetical protein [Thermoflexus sp.]MDW8065456.1 hypothetical protein [Anaerolineae bacterium]
MLTHPAAIYIAGWLPDGQRLLITRDVPGKHRQTIDVLDIETGELITYAEWEESPGRPVWLSALKAVAYLTLVAEEGKEPPTRYHPELWISYGSPQQAERLATDADGPLVADPDGKRLWYFLRSEPNRLQLCDVETRSPRGTLVDLAPLRYPKPELEWAMRDLELSFWAARRPDGSQVLFYSQFWTFLLDVRSGRWCELEVGEHEPWMHIPPWPLLAQWSPDGRYVAFVTTDTLDTRLLSTWLTILDVETGERRTLSPGSETELGRHYVTDMAWFPDSRYLVALGVVRMEEGVNKEGLFLVNAVTGESRRVLPEYEFGGGWDGRQLAWDPSGSFLAVYCPTSEEGRLCIVPVSPKGVEGKHP